MCVLVMAHMKNSKYYHRNLGFIYKKCVLFDGCAWVCVMRCATLANRKVSRLIPFLKLARDFHVLHFLTASQKAKARFLSSRVAPRTRAAFPSLFSISHANVYQQPAARNRRTRFRRRVHVHLTNFVGWRLGLRVSFAAYIRPVSIRHLFHQLVENRQRARKNNYCADEINRIPVIYTYYSVKNNFIILTTSS